MSRPRDHLPEVSEAMRQAVDRALELDLTPGQLRVFLVAIRQVPFWSRLSDRVYLDDITSKARVSRSTASRALKMLADEGVLVWRPARGQGLASTLGFHPAKQVTHDDSLIEEKQVTQDDSLHDADEAVNAPDELLTGQTGALNESKPSTKQVKPEHLTSHPGRLTTEVNPEVDPEVNPDYVRTLTGSNAAQPLSRQRSAGEQIIDECWECGGRQVVVYADRNWLCANCEKPVIEELEGEGRGGR